MSLAPALARRAAALMGALGQQQRGGGGAAAAAACSAGRLFNTSAGPRAVVEVSDDATLAKALAAAAQSDAPSVVNYTAVWCGPCKAMAKPMADLAAAHPSVAFLKVDIDAPALAASVAAAGVTAVPTYVVRRGGDVLETIQGARLELLQKAVQQAAAATK